jgi:hypothetical protein
MHKQIGSKVRSSGSTWIRKELDDAYDQSVYAPNQQFITTRRRLASEAMLKRVTPERIAYGPPKMKSSTSTKLLGPTRR